MSALAPAIARQSTGTFSGWLHRRLVDGVAALGPRTVVELASAAGRVAQRVRQRPRPEDVADVFRDQSVRLDASRTAREISAFAYRNRALSAVVRRRGLSAATSLVDPASLPPLERLASSTRTAAVLVTWHLGPGCGISAAFDQVGVGSLAIVRRPPPAVDRRSEVVLAGGGEAERIAALWRAVRHLKDGGLVVIAADGLSGERLRHVTFLGRRIRLARGPFVLARLSGAPIVPLVARWTPEGLIRVELGCPLNIDAVPADGEPFEVAAATATAAWMEARVLQSPGELRPHTLRWLAGSPRA